MNYYSKQYSQYCPSSSLIDTYNDGIHGYPIDIFDKEFYQVSMNSNLFNDVFRCETQEKKFKDHICSNKGKCPLVKQNIIDALNVTSWTTKTSLCHFQSQLHNSYATTNIFIMGGSVTLGTLTYGCCCSNEFEEKCFINNDTSSCGSSQTTKAKKNIRNCRWSGPFERWIKSKSIGHVNVHNMAVAGANSAYFADHVLQLLNDSRIQNFSSNDIVFLDFAVNDAVQTDNAGAKVANMKIGLELLIRNIYFRSIKGSWPTVAILEFWPYPENSILGEYDYSQIYAQVARKYQLPIWSYKNMVLSSYFNNDSITYSKIIRYKDTHPPWYIHLLYSDMISAILTSEFNNCFYRNDKSIDANPADLDFKNLPSPYVETPQCKDLLNTQSYVLSIPQGKDGGGNPIISSSSKSKKRIWAYYEDAETKPGWIDENLSKDDNICRGVTDSIYESSISFELNSKSHFNFETNKYLIKIDYLRTYLNAGQSSCINQISHSHF